MRALLSVWDKRGLTELATGLVALGVELVASGGTAAALRDAGIDHLEVEAVTGSPEMLVGAGEDAAPRASTAGSSRTATTPGTVADLEAQGIEPIDLVVCNLYPFRTDPSIELIDVGGPTMVRAAAKNHAHVGVLVDPDDYDASSASCVRTARSRDATRARLARTAFAHTAAYDAAIVSWFDGDVAPTGELPVTLHPTLGARPGPPLRGEPAPARRALPARGDALVLGDGPPARRRRAQLPQPLRRRRRVAARPRARGRRAARRPRCS